MKFEVPRCKPTPRRPSRRRAVALAIAVLALGCQVPLSTHAQTLEESSLSTPLALKQAMQDQRADYRSQQFQRLSHNSDRDSLIAAVMIGMSDGRDRPSLDGQAEVAKRLQRGYAKDPLALFTLALACQLQKEPCADPGAYDSLVSSDPGNAVHWLMRPNGAAPSDEQLHSAAKAPFADAHLRDIVRIVRAALAGQSAPAEPAGIDQRELALLLRRDAVEQVPLPVFGAAVSMCKAAIEPRRADCLELGRRLQDDRSGTILSRMIGGVLLRRLAKGTPEEEAAKQMRREYVWLSEQLEASTVRYAEQLQEDVAVHGEWEACQRALQRLGSARTPPSEWSPKNPQALLLSEERTPESGQ